MRVGGRLANSNLTFCKKFPIILPGNHPFTIAYVRFIHNTNSHVGAQALTAFLLQKFWIINVRKISRKIIRNCIVCFRQKPRNASQLMGQLPVYRVVGNARPFERAGVDFAGPIYIHYKIRGKKPTKAYIALFVCLLTKYCHLKIVSDLSSSAFIPALKRFFARRGLNTDIYSDNDTNFIGASREI